MEVRPALRGNTWAIAAVTIAVTGVLAVATSSKVAFYLDAFERANLLYAAPLAAVIGLFVVLAYPGLALHAMAFLLPFNFVGGYWGNDLPVLLAKLAMNLLLAVSLVPTFAAPAAQRAWLTRTRIGIALLAWLSAIVMGIVIGLLGGSNREYWVRESGWMLFFFAALPFGTLLVDRRQIDRLIGSVCAGAAVLQGYAFWTLMTGARYTRTDVYQGVQSFFRAPYSCVSLFVLYLAAAAFLFRASAGRLTRGYAIGLFAAIGLLGGGLLASMVRSLWISGTVGMLVVAGLAPWDRRTARAAMTVASGAILAVVVVAAVDRLSPESSGNWTASAITFLQDLGSKDSTSRVTREIEWGYAVDVWKESPVVGLGFGYSFPQTDLGQIPEEIRPEPFYIHNSYLNLLAKVGLFGMAALLYLMWSIGRSALAILRHEDADLRDRILATTIVASLAALALLTTTMPVLTAGDPAAYLGLLAGITVALQRTQTQPAT